MSAKLSENCRLVDAELDRQLQQPGSELSEDARSHIEHCPACQELYHWTASKTPVSEAIPKAGRSIQSALISSLVPVKPISAPSVIFYRFLLAFAVSAIALIAMTDRAGFHHMNKVQFAAITAVLGIGAVLFSAELVWRMIPGSYHYVQIGAILTICGVGLIASIALFFPWPLPVSAEAFVEQGWPCALMELAIAVPTAGVFWLFARRGAPFPSAATGAAVLGLAGLLAFTVLQFQCMRQQAPHLLVWHLGMLVLLIFGGTVFGHTFRTRSAS